MTNGSNPNVISLLDGIQPSEYPRIRDEIYGFLKNLLKTKGSSIDTIIAVDRKGMRILKDYFVRHPAFSKLYLTSDNKVRAEHVNNRSVLIFDDAIHTGSRISEKITLAKRLGARSVNVACLLSSVNGLGRIKSDHPDVEVHTCKVPFQDYSDQSNAYMTWELTYLEGLGVKDNPDYPMIVISATPNDLQKISKSMTAAIRKVLKIEEYFEIESRVNRENCRSISFEIASKEQTIPAPYDSIAEPDQAKIRCVTTRYGTYCEVMILPLINPRFGSDNCTILSTFPEKCLCRLVGLDHKDESFCKVCVPFFLNAQLLSRIQPGIIVFLKKQGIKVKSFTRESPSFARFFR